MLATVLGYASIIEKRMRFMPISEERFIILRIMPGVVTPGIIGSIRTVTVLGSSPIFMYSAILSNKSSAFITPGSYYVPPKPVILKCISFGIFVSKSFCMGKPSCLVIRYNPAKSLPDTFPTTARLPSTTPHCCTDSFPSKMSNICFTWNAGSVRSDATNILGFSPTPASFQIASSSFDKIVFFEFSTCLSSFGLLNRCVSF